MLGYVIRSLIIIGIFAAWITFIISSLGIETAAGRLDAGIADPTDTWDDPRPHGYFGTNSVGWE